jgi:deoxyadenosine/deoxycytidine kinase
MNYEEIKYKLNNVYFVNGTAYAGKSTIVKMIADRLGFYFCGENYNLEQVLTKVTPKEYPNLCYFKTMKSWEENVSRTPQEYDAWITGGQVEITPFEIEDLIEVSKNQKVIVDTNIQVDILHKISDYNHVAILLSPQCMSVNDFFNRKDPDKLFILEQIKKTENPKLTLENFGKCIEKVNSLEHYYEFLNSGFKYFVRKENSNLEDRYNQIIKHFKLI